MAVWRRDEHRGDQAELRGQPADGGARQHRVRQSAERRARPDLRLDPFISVPDIEAQVSPNNLMYSHSKAYTFDNYTNTGLQATLALNKNWFVQLGVTVGTEAMPWHLGQTIPNPFPNPVFPGSTMLKDPGAKPSITAGVGWQSDSGHDNIYVVADAINDGTWGYNNLQWYGITWYHKFNDQWHFAWENYILGQRNVLNAADPAGIIANGGFPFSPAAAGRQLQQPTHTRSN